MKIESARLQASAGGYDDCPSTGLPEFAFIGRSNVGKSSLINLLTERRELAHTSARPGKTQRINLFTINEAWTLVDLPGYGYAKLSRAKQEAFNREVSGYLTQRENLKQVFLLLDSQIELLDSDLAFADWLQNCGVGYSIILTKTDRGSRATVDRFRAELGEALTELGLEPVAVYACSAKLGTGRGPLLQWIEQQLPKKRKKKGSPKLNLGWMR
ncbi:MAG: ribosome biogenesis GTP-binding protein YihA/YsxC [Opitutales bacterium]